MWFYDTLAGQTGKVCHQCYAENYSVLYVPDDIEALKPLTPRLEPRAHLGKPRPPRQKRLTPFQQSVIFIYIYIYIYLYLYLSR
jgi:hypothetical protein